MSKRSKQSGRANQPSSAEGTSELARISNLLALLAVKGESQTDKILTLTAAGFTAAEIAQLIRSTPNTVSVTIYQAKKPGRTRSRKKQE